MQVEEAISLIKPGIAAKATPEYWADLGCGSGTFTYALAHLLSPGSSITAVDSSPQRLNKTVGTKVSIQFKQSDFNLEHFQLPTVNGILMANSLHFIQDKESLIDRLERWFVKEKQFLIIEYESDTPNQWVPFPVKFNELSVLFGSRGYEANNKLNEKSSAFGGTMYAALFRAKNS